LAIESLEVIHDPLKLARQLLCLAYLKLRTRKDVSREHKRLMDAALSRNVERATALLAEHYQETTRICMEAGLCVSEMPEAA